MVIDAHLHFWHYDPRADDNWQPAGVLEQNYLPADFYPLLRASGVDGCVAVQAGESLAETEFLLELSRQHPWILGVVGWVDLRAADLPQHLRKWQRAGARVQGVRQITQDLPAGGLLDPAFVHGLRTLHDYGYSYDLLLRHHQLAEALELIGQLPPDMPLVIDHLAKPPVAAGILAPWAADISRHAERPATYVKLSGLVTEADHADWEPEQLYPYCEVILEAFGADRIMYGSDWPVCLLAASYPRQKSAVDEFLAGLCDAGERTAIMGGTAQRFYRV